jgi:hypothetical protein
MLHLLADATPEPRPQVYAEAVSRLASIRHALRLVGTLGDGPSPDLNDNDEAIATAWDDAGNAGQRCFDRRSERLVTSTAAGVEALLVVRQDGGLAHPEASKFLVDQIRRELADVARVILD